MFVFSSEASIDTHTKSSETSVLHILYFFFTMFVFFFLIYFVTFFKDLFVVTFN